MSGWVGGTCVRWICMCTFAPSCTPKAQHDIHTHSPAFDRLLPLAKARALEACAPLSSSAPLAFALVGLPPQGEEEEEGRGRGGALSLVRGRVGNGSGSGEQGRMGARLPSWKKQRRQEEEEQGEEEEEEAAKVVSLREARRKVRASSRWAVLGCAVSAYMALLTVLTYNQPINPPHHSLVSLGWNEQGRALGASLVLHPSPRPYPPGLMEEGEGEGEGEGEEAWSEDAMAARVFAAVIAEVCVTHLGVCPSLLIISYA